MSQGWREADSLKTLETEIQRYYPGTTTWEIGDSDHQNSWSDHNPNDANVVCAKDILADGGLNLRKLADHLVAYPPSNLRYVIFDRSIAERRNGFEWREYNGSNPHDKHLHVSVGNGPDGRSTRDYDDTSSWRLDKIGTAPSKPSKPTNPDNDNDTIGEKMPTVKRGSKGHAVKVLQAVLGIWGWNVSRDGIFGPQTDKALRAFQAKHAKPSDGIAGPITWGALLGVK